MWLARHNHLLPPPHRRRLLLTSPLRLLSSVRTSRPPPTAHPMVDYLVTSCGLSPLEASKASRRLPRLEVPHKPDAVLRLLKEEGLCVAQIRRVVLADPRLLMADPAKTIEPKIRALRGAGFAGLELTQLIAACPLVLILRDSLPRIQFWKDLLGSNQNFLKASGKVHSILGLRLKEKVSPQLSLLCRMGVPRFRIGTIVLRNPRLVCINIDRIKDVAEQVQSMGLIPGSRLFARILLVLLCCSSSTVDAKFSLLRGFGWSQGEIMSSVQRFPNILNISEKKIRAAMDFLLKEAGCDPSYVALRPVLLGYRLEERLMPRYYVLEFLRRKGLRGGGNDLHRAMTFAEKTFVEKYITPYNKEFPEISKIYHAACAKAISNG